MALKILIIWNIFVMALYGIDKLNAKLKNNRICETGLISFAFLFGAFGAVLGVFLFNHKTSKKKFKILLPLALFFNLIIIFFLYQKTIHIAVSQ